LRNFSYPKYHKDNTDPIIYVIIIPGKLNTVHNANHIIIAILKSQPPSHAHFDIKICRKKNVNIARAPIKPFNITISFRFTPKNILNTPNDIRASTNNARSMISSNHFNIIV
jgi:hypothetical protein